jgi:murein L,D-transpeptidase YcbB/YkuD
MNKNYHKYYLGGVAVAVVFAGFLAVKVGVNLHDVLKDFSRSPPPTAAAPQAPGVAFKPAAVAPEWSAALAAHIVKQPAAERESLTRVYEQFGYAPLWVNSSVSRLRDLSSVAAFAEAQAIDTTALNHLLQTAGNRASTLEASALNDIRITAEVMRLAEALRLGAVPTATLGRSWILPADSFDAASGLTAALKDGGLKKFMAGLAPPDPAYRSLVNALDTYRDIVENGGWPEIPGKDEIKLDADLTLSDARTLALRDRLTAEGYLRAGTTVDAAQLTGAVKTFQERNGLEPDGRIGRDTIAALNIPAHERMGQIAANLERWRHTPRERGDRYIAVNTAAATLDYMNDGKSTLHLKTVTGAPRHATPILTAKITSIVLNPVWSIPPSISTKEILPKLQKDPDYLAKNNMVVINGSESDPHGQAVDWSQYDAKTLPFSFRQRAGDDNALGYIKFHMPNPQNIYLHDTPSRSFFAKAERHLSHGCVRVDQPQILGEHVLKQESPEWTAETLAARFGNGGTQSIVLKTPLPVYTFYWTVFPENGTIAFRTDVYKRDKALADALGLKMFGGTTPGDVKQNIAAN